LQLLFLTRKVDTSLYTGIIDAPRVDNSAAETKPVRPAGRMKNKKPAAGFSGGGLDFLCSSGFLFYPPPENTPAKPTMTAMTVMEHAAATGRGLSEDECMRRDASILKIYLNGNEKSIRV
jgi:hypothetical protein